MKLNKIFIFTFFFLLSASLKMEWLDGDHKKLGTGVVLDSLSGSGTLDEWIELSGSKIAPAQAADGRFLITTETDNNWDGSVYYDSASVAIKEFHYPNISGYDSDEFYDLIQENIFWYFYNEANPDNGLVKDRARNFEDCDVNWVSSASSAMGLAAMAIAHARADDWDGVDRGKVYDRAKLIMESYHDATALDPSTPPDPEPQELVHYNGFFYHFTDMYGVRDSTNTEISTIDTTLFVAAALFAGEYFESEDDGYLLSLATTTYGRIDWRWMTDDHEQGILQWGWTPEDGGKFDQGEISGYSEGILSYIFGAGAPVENKRLDESGWEELDRGTTSHMSLDYIYEHTLFTHQYQLLFLDLAGRRDNHASYGANTYKATIHHRRFAHHDDDYDTYNKYSWGIGATEGPDGDYFAYGLDYHSGIIALSNLAAAASDLPGETEASLRWLYETYGTDIWGKYGFTDSYNTDSTVEKDFNRDSMWRCPFVFGVQQGAVLLAIENMRTGLVRDTLMDMEAGYIQSALKTLNFKEDTEAPGKIDNFKAEISSSAVLLTWDAPAKEVEDGIYELRFSSEFDTPDKAPDHYLDYDIIWSTSFSSGDSQQLEMELTEKPKQRHPRDKQTVDEKKVSFKWTAHTYNFWLRAADDYFNWSKFSDIPEIEIEEYEFQLADSEDFKDKNIIEFFVTGKSEFSRELEDGEYYWRVRAHYGGENNYAPWSEINTFEVKEVIETVKEVFVYPNPFKPGDPDYGAVSGGGVMIGALPRGAQVRIFTVVGELVDKFTHRKDETAYQWKKADDIASGVYILVVDYEGETETRKFSVIK